MLVEAFFTRLIRCGRLTVHYADGRSEVYGGEPGPNVTIRLHNTAVGRRIACNPSLGAAESYMDGLLSVENGELYGEGQVATAQPVDGGQCNGDAGGVVLGTRAGDVVRVGVDVDRSRVPARERGNDV